VSEARRRLSSGLAVLAVGLVVAGAAWAGSGARTGFTLGVFFLILAGGQVLWSSRGDGDVAALVGGTGDERQRVLDVRATAVAGLAMGTFSVGMAVAALARNDDNPWLLVCLVGALTYVIALGYFRARS
jgi:hypothetical protein